MFKKVVGTQISVVRMTDEEIKQDMKHVLDTLWTIIPNHPFYHAIKHEARYHFDFILFGVKQKDLNELKLPDGSTYKPTEKGIVLIRTLLLYLCAGVIPIRFVIKEDCNNFKPNTSHWGKINPAHKDELRFMIASLNSSIVTPKSLILRDLRQLIPLLLHLLSIQTKKIQLEIENS